ncbi:type I restriction endonuclease subunit R [Fructobacillus ficulneus]|uniref:Type I restriction enzyme endonuclease subunit n=1 Tax=Fructobacillus ficulneus TaxID=157463 RepID=A0A0K8MH59_9LACO|nr:type I restriction endonuclease subunit R [Fructobacillus ficulneus]GAO99901.1 type I restriction-modification system, restriction subunit R [Fructobacillus ficulneus]
MSEEQFERAVLTKLKSEGWEYREDLSNHTDDVIEDNWRSILNDNNRVKLAGTPLSDTEFDNLKLELLHNKTPYDAQLMLAGAGGIGTLPLTRDDGTQLEIEIFYGDEIAGGHSRYEVVNQITFPNLPRTLGNNRRIDIMLLINGLPVAHIEEKDESRSNQYSAFQQFQKYDSDGMYTGLFSFVQVMFMLTQNSSHYFARPKNATEYNKEFIFGWRDDDGKDVTNAMTFIHQVMGIPALHRLVTVNMIPDADNDNLMVMRSYQIQATRAILDRMRVMENNHLIEKEGGYVWHTTGSGKTVTSFKVAQLLASLPRVRHVLFIVDRVDLVTQTAENFKSFAYKTFENRIKVVKGHELKKALKQKSDTASNIFLITVQGLAKAVKAGLVSDERMVILMDEAHRSASGDAVEKIKKAFSKTTWFGFTGTPNFYSNEDLDVKTTRDISTHDVFGDRLHRYTIKDAIGDQNVLGFDVTYYTPDVEQSADKKLNEKELEKAVYSSLPFREAVVQDIIDNWRNNHSGPIEMGIRQPNMFHGMFAVSGKQAVVAYYKLFKRMAPDLRVAMSYSRDEDNGEGTSDLQEDLKAAITDYVNLFDTHNFFDDKDTERAYLNDITKRIAHKKPYNKKLTPEQELENPQRLDLIIVSDQLLTGFDSKYVNTIYMDKILKEGLLIQAMSRTNRTIDRVAKPHGKVRFFRKGEQMEENVRNALVIYTKGGNDTLEDIKNKPDTDETDELENDDILAQKKSTQIQELIPEINHLKNLAGEDFSEIPKSEKEQVEFVSLAAKVNRSVQQLIQRGYNFGEELPIIDKSGNETGEKVRLNLMDKDEFSALQARMNDINDFLPREEQIDLTEIKIAIDKYGHEIIDYDKLVELLNAYMKEISEAGRKEIENHINKMDAGNKSEIEEILAKIESGEYTKPFDTESLNKARDEIRSGQQELKLRRWAADNDVNSNAIVAAFELFLPNVSAVDNPKFKQEMNKIEDSNKMTLLKRRSFENKLQEFFKTL